MEISVVSWNHAWLKDWFLQHDSQRLQYLRIAASTLEHGDNEGNIEAQQRHATPTRDQATQTGKRQKGREDTE